MTAAAQRRRNAPHRRAAVPTALGAAALLLAGADARSAGPVHWDYPQGVPFTELKLEGVGLDLHGRLTPGLRAAELTAAGPEVFWCLAPDGAGGLYAGSGHDGQVWHAPRGRPPRLLAALGQPEIFALLPVASHLYAGGGPDGRLYRVSRTGEATAWGSLREGYVWSLAAGPDGRLYAGAGSPAAVYRVDGQERLERLAELPATHVLALALTADGQLLIGTQGPGLIISLDPRRPQQRRILQETAQDEVRQLVPDAEGTWHALAVARAPLALIPSDTSAGGGSPATGVVDLLRAAGGERSAPDRAALYRIGPDGLVTQVWGGATPVQAAIHLQGRGWLGAGPLGDAESQSALWWLESGGPPQPLAAWAGGEITDLARVGDRDGRALLAVTQGRPGRWFLLEDRPAVEAFATAPPLDGGAPVRWGRLRWEGDTATGAAPRWSVRGGPRSAPDDTWSDWSAPWSDQDAAIPLPPSRFLQWRVSLSHADPATAIAAVTVSGYAPNGPPRIVRFEVLPPGELAPSGRMEGREAITETFRGGLQVEYSLPSRRDRSLSPLDASPVRSVRTFVWQGWDPNGDRLVYSLHYQRLGQSSWRPIGEETFEGVQAWDTRGIPDGLYVVRLAASDAPDNRPGEELTAARLCAPLLVDNSPPRLSGVRVGRTPGGVSVSFVAEDDASPLAEAWLELPDGSRVRLDPEDGICDSRRERFAQETPWPRPGRAAPPEPWRLRFGVVDRAGNVAVEEGEAR